MNISVHKEKLLPLLGQIQGILEKRTNLPILSNILIEAQKDKSFIFASDSELSFSGNFKSSIKKEGKIVVNGRKLFEIVKELPSGAFTLSGESNNNIKIKGEHSNFRIHGLKPEDFPPFPCFEQKKTYQIPVEDLLEVIDKTLYCVSLDESRYHLTGVFCEKISDSSYRFVATDGHRMSFIDILSKDFKDFKDGIIIPKKGLQEIKKMVGSSEEGGMVELSLEKPRLITKFKNQILAIRLIEGNYPNYKLLIPKEEGKEILLNKEVFLSALRRISVLTNARFKGITFIFKNNSLTLEISQPELGEASETIDCKYKGEELKIRFNSKYILDILNSLHEETIKITLKDSLSSGVIQGDGNDRYKSIVMPMKF